MNSLSAPSKVPRTDGPHCTIANSQELLATFHSPNSKEPTLQIWVRLQNCFKQLDFCRWGSDETGVHIATQQQLFSHPFIGGLAKEKNESDSKLAWLRKIVLPYFWIVHRPGPRTFTLCLSPGSVHLYILPLKTASKPSVVYWCPRNRQEFSQQLLLISQTFARERQRERCRWPHPEHSL